eukprot:1344873-Amorphochlora_amoeboformis.AAC.1
MRERGQKERAKGVSKRTGRSPKQDSLIRRNKHKRKQNPGEANGHKRIWIGASPPARQRAAVAGSEVIMKPAMQAADPAPWRMRNRVIM